MKFYAKWITAPRLDGNVVPVFQKCFRSFAPIQKATLTVTALGVYEVFLNNQRVGNYVLAPGWTVYKHRLQYQCYDITEMLDEENVLDIQVGRGWYCSPIGVNSEQMAACLERSQALLAQVDIVYADGSTESIATDESWQYGESAIRRSEIYYGEIYDATVQTDKWYSAVPADHPMDILIPQEGEEIREQERVLGKRIIVTPEGDTLIDFGQEVTGYVEFTVDAHEGDEVFLLHSEVLDKNGNFYNENYREAEAEIHYICKEGRNTYHPHLTFFGFRQIKLVKWPGDLSTLRPEQFTAIAVYSKMERTGWLSSSNANLNQFFSNVFWGQRGNFLDIPTDCPQRNERLGWTGDAQAFCKAACYNFKADRFFTKWLKDVYADQCDADGAVAQVVPNIFAQVKPSAAWSDAATIIPWRVYMTYGNPEILKNQFTSMKDWVDRISKITTQPDLWTGCWHYGDWLALDAYEGSYRGASNEDLIASAFYAHSVDCLVQAGRVLGKDVDTYASLYSRIVEKYKKTFTEYQTQTECVLTLHFGLTDQPQMVADRLVELIEKAGRMETGFVGTPYLLHALSDNGYEDLAYSLLLREKYPSWLYSVTKGATTVWEHWDGIKEDGSFWSKDMNSYNHYAYGAAIDWVYEKAAGIQPLEPGFKRVRIAPIATDRLDHLNVSLDTAFGRITSNWCHAEGSVRYDITIPVAGEINIDGKTYLVEAGNYIFFK